MKQSVGFCEVRQGALENKAILRQTVQVFREKQSGIFVHENSVALTENICNKLRAEVTVFAFEWNVEKSKRNANLVILQSFLLFHKGIEDFLDALIMFLRNRNFVEHTWNRVPVRADIAGHFFYQEAFGDKAVEGVHVLIQTDGSMSVVEAGQHGNGTGAVVRETGQQDGDFAWVFLMDFILNLIVKCICSCLCRQNSRQSLGKFHYILFLSFGFM